jgi:hypothetical protein
MITYPHGAPANGMALAGQILHIHLIDVVGLCTPIHMPTEAMSTPWHCGPATPSTESPMTPGMPFVAAPLSRQPLSQGSQRP